MSSPSTLAPPDTAALVSATEALYRAALGPGRTASYLPVFARFDERGLAGTHWNHAAAWLNLNWLLYRRLWRPALLYALALAAALGLWWWARGLMAAWPPGVRWGLLAAIGVLAVVVPGWWGTAWLHADVRRRMTDAVRRARTVQEACGLLQRGGPGRWAWALALLGQLALLGALGHRSGGGPVAAAVPEPVLAERMVAGEVASAPKPAPAPAPEPVPVSAPPPASAEGVSEPPPVSPAAAPVTDTPRPRWHGSGVNVGIFGDPSNAERAAARLRQAGLPVRSDPVESARGPLIRVRVGPFETREQAEAAAETVRNLGLEARVFGP